MVECGSAIYWLVEYDEYVIVWLHFGLFTISRKIIKPTIYTQKANMYHYYYYFYYYYHHHYTYSYYYYRRIYHFSACCCCCCRRSLLLPFVDIIYSSMVMIMLCSAPTKWSVDMLFEMGTIELLHKPTFNSAFGRNTWLAFTVNGSNIPKILRTNAWIIYFTHVLYANKGASKYNRKWSDRRTKFTRIFYMTRSSGFVAKFILTAENCFYFFNFTILFVQCVPAATVKPELLSISIYILWLFLKTLRLS